MKTAILAILLFCIMIFPHELGHFIAAKLCGIQVNEFAFGMGPVLWKKQRGETLHTIRLFPIGGFCAMEGEDGEEDIPDNIEGEYTDEEGDKVLFIPEHNPRAFCNKKPWQKLVVLAAGSFMNMICAVLIMAMVVGIMGFNTTTIGSVAEDTPAYEAGLRAGDRIKVIDVIEGLDADGNKLLTTYEIKHWSDVSQVIKDSNGKQLDFYVISRKNHDTKNEVVFSVTPELVTSQDEQGNETSAYKIGITTKVSHNPWLALRSGAQSTVNMTKLIFTSLRQLFTGEASVSDMSGPVGMVQMVNETANYGFWYYGFLVALICVNLAVINMLPLPALDGGRIIFVCWSWITGKPVSAKVEGAVHAIGLILLLALMVYVTGADITRIFNK